MIRWAPLSLRSESTQIFGRCDKGGHKSGIVIVLVEDVQPELVTRIAARIAPQIDQVALSDKLRVDEVRRRVGICESGMCIQELGGVEECQRYRSSPLVAQSWAIRRDLVRPVVP